MALSTSVGINGDRVELVFGAHFDVRFGKDDRVIRDALLDRRATNGDLIFVLSGAGPSSEVRVRPSSIDEIVGSGVDHAHGHSAPDAEYLADAARQAASDALVEAFVAEGDTDPDSVAAKVHAELGPIIPDRLDGETGSAYLARLERVMGASYVTWIGTETGQAALESVNAEARAARKVVPIGEAKTAKLTKAGREKLVDAGADPEAVSAATSAEDVPGVVVRTGKAYADRNQVWKCGTCKGRTRKPVCTGRPDGSHEAVSAPAGKRLVDRLGDR